MAGGRGIAGTIGADYEEGGENCPAPTGHAA